MPSHCDGPTSPRSRSVVFTPRPVAVPDGSPSGSLPVLRYGGGNAFASPAFDCPIHYAFFPTLRAEKDDASLIIEYDL